VSDRWPLPTVVLGLGNVLMRDDAFGPVVVETLLATWDIPPEVRVIDLGTPGLDLVPYVVGQPALVLVDTVRTDAAPGTVRRYGLRSLERPLPARVSPHDPGVTEALFAASLAGQKPEHAVLVAAVPQDVSMGTGLSPALRAAVPVAVAQVVEELRGLGFVVERRPDAAPPSLWWEQPVAPC
jgi:hydrogenase maturation protease